MNGSEQLLQYLRRIRFWSLVVGLISAIGCAAAYFLDPTAALAFFPAYLIAFMFWLGIALGSWVLSLLHHLTGGAWGRAILRTLESSASTLVFMALAFVPLLFGLKVLYSWARPDVVAHDEIIQGKAQYLNEEFFIVRAISYFVLWILLSQWVNRWTDEPTAADQQARLVPLQRLSAGSLLVYGLTVTFASVDWVMSLEPHWFSSMFGVLFMASHALSAMSFAILVNALFSKYHPTVLNADPDRFHDLGNLLLAFVMFWSYVNFMQYLIIWAGNLPEEASWYVRRIAHGWGIIPVLLIGLHFIVPFFLLLLRATKRSAGRLAFVAAVLLLMRFVDLNWMVLPTFYPAGLTFHWIGLLTMLAIGGLWLAVFSWRLAERVQLPIFITHDPEALDEPSGYTSSAH